MIMGTRLNWPVVSAVVVKSGIDPSQWGNGTFYDAALSSPSNR